MKQHCLYSTTFWESSERDIAQSAGAVEYTDCISTEGLNSPNECPGHDTKQSDRKAPVILELWGL